MSRITFNDVGEICSTAHDCAAFQIRRRWLLSSAGNNSTQSGSRLSQRDTDGENSDDGDDPSDPWCAPQYCTLESTCGGAWTLYGAPLDTPLGATASNPNANGTAISCCRGFIDNAQCGLASGSVDTCGSGHTCSTSNPRGGSNSATHARTSAHDTRDLVASLRQSARGGLDTMDEMPLGTCVSQEPHQQVWIGIVLVLIGGATLNIGLNLQKYAFRKREERANADSLAAAQDHSPRLSMPPSSDVKVKFYSSGAIDPRYQTSNSQGFAGSDPSVDKPKARNTMSTPASVAFPASHSVNKRRILGGYSGKSNASTKNYRQIIDDVPDFDDLAPAKSGETKKEGELSSTILASQRTDRLAAPVMDAEIFEMPHTRLGTPSPKDSQENILQMHTSYGSQTRLQPQQNNRHINDRSTQASAIASRPKQWYQSIHTKIASKHGSKSPFSSPMWVVGLLIFILGNVINFIALQFAPQSLVAPLGAVALVTNVIVAPLLNNEKLSLKTGTAIFRHPLSPFDKYIPPVSPESRYVRYGLPLAYASLGSLMATLTTLFAKSLVNLLSVSLFDRDNQFTNFISWVILLVAAFTAVSQVYWINQGLLRYDALLQVPVFYVVWTVFDIVGGGVYFNEFMLFTTVKYVVFAVGVAVIFSGVGLLSHRLKNSK
ncbi:hypothetical protein GGI12_002050 [Dipsacomyces acuminosporus]|nr:hypothetical protein GGI12_002050 [Dipsacomyces acuminosporus]